jgi:hypothetical protein
MEEPRLPGPSGQPSPPGRQPEQASNDLDLSEEWSGQRRNERSRPPNSPHVVADPRENHGSGPGVPGSGHAGPEWTSSWTSPAPRQQTRDPEPGQSRGSARERGHARVRGVARAVQLRDQENGHILSFRVEQYDRAGNRLRPIAVELKGAGLSGQLGDGEEVEVTGKWRHGTIRARTVVNITTGAHVRVRGAKFGWLGLLVFVGLVIAGVLLFVNGVIGGGSGGPPGESPGGSGSTIRVPDLSGMSDTSAIRALNEAGLHWSGDFEDSNKVPRGKVIRTDPPAGTEVEQGKTVIFVVSTGPPFNR